MNLRVLCLLPLARQASDWLQGPDVCVLGHKDRVTHPHHLLGPGDSRSLPAQPLVDEVL